ncbi:hypothetical protein FHS10_003850 [Mucilaginibacter dorajii]|nr:hypothetical protein [Mucilaginibacter dorajii]
MLLYSLFKFISKIFLYTSLSTYTPVIASYKIRRTVKVGMTKRIKTQCHAELVSAPHSLSVLHAENLSCGVLKQVQDDFRFYNLSWVGTKQSPIYRVAVQIRPVIGDCFVPRNDIALCCHSTFRISRNFTTRNDDLFIFKQAHNKTLVFGWRGSFSNFQILEFSNNSK